MGKNIKCPVCGKADIPNYLNEDIKCPCCGSDLSIYRIIEKIPEDGHKLNAWKPISVVTILVAVGLTFAFYTQRSSVSLESSRLLAQFKDSIEVLNDRLDQRQDIEVQYVSEYSYTVLRGDSYWSISKKFYGTGTRAAEIAQYNNKTLETPLKIGDILKIK